jgi:hypothetical protein
LRRIPLLSGEQQRVVVGGSAGIKRRAAAILSDFGFKAKPGAPPPSGRSSSVCSHPSWGGGRAKGQEGAGARASGPSGEGLELDTVVSGSAGKRRRNDNNRNDRYCKRSAVMRVCTAGDGSGSDLGAGGSGNEAGGGEMEYGGRVAGIGVSAGNARGEMRAVWTQWADRGWWETGGLDVV